MKTRIIHTKIWEDDFFSSLDKAARYFFFYIITNQRINLCGVYELPDRVLEFETGFDKEELSKLKEALAPKVYFYNGWVYVVNAKRLGGYKGEKNDIACDRELAEVPKNVKDVLFKLKTDRVCKGYAYPRHTSINHKSEIINKKSETNKSYKQVINRSIEYLRNIPEVDVEEFITNFKVSRKSLLEKANTLNDYCAAKGKSYNDYKAFLRNAVRRDFGERTPEEIKTHKQVQATIAIARAKQVKPQPRMIRSNVSPEQAKANLEKLRKLKNKTGIGKFD